MASSANHVSGAHPQFPGIGSRALAEIGLAEFDFCLWLYNDKESI